MRLHSIQMDRAVGVVAASAAGDTLGSHDEFGPSIPDDAPVRFGVGHFGHDVGEWTDDTAMAIPTAKDIGSQTSSVLARLHGDVAETAARTAAGRARGERPQRWQRVADAHRPGRPRLPGRRPGARARRDGRAHRAADPLGARQP